jgi:cell wall-associated NlpC family hydrolase
MIDDLIGKPYKKHGRGPDAYDCYGLCIEVSKRLGRELPEVNDIINHEWMVVDKPELGDIVMIISPDSRHVGVMIDKNTFLQVSQGSRGVHKMKTSHPWAKGRIQGIYRFVK